MRIQFAIKGQLGIINELILVFLIFLYQTPPLSSIEWLSVVLPWSGKLFIHNLDENNMQIWVRIGQQQLLVATGMYGVLGKYENFSFL